MEDKEYSYKEFKSYSDLLSQEKDLKSKLYSDYKNKIDTQREFAEFAIDFIKNNEEKMLTDSTPFRDLANFFTVKAIKTFRAIQYLIENGFGEDAAVLIRCQFELLTNFLYISKEDQNARAEKYIRYEYLLKEKFLKKLFHSNLFYEVYEKLPEERKKEIRENCEKYEKLYPCKRFWSGKTVEQMADDVGLKDYYISVYCLFSNLVHSNVKSSEYYVVGDDNVIRFIIAITDHLIGEVIEANGNFILRILKQLNEIFQLGQEDVIQEAQNRFCEAFSN